jgi:hypothetical protein
MWGDTVDRMEEVDALEKMLKRNSLETNRTNIVIVSGLCKKEIPLSFLFA